MLAFHAYRLIEDLYCEHGDGLTIGSVWYDDVTNVTYRSVFPSLFAMFSRKMQKLPLFSCILTRNDGKNRAGVC